MAEPHDRCTLLGCTLGREHTGDHVGPRCPVCTITWVWSGVANTWRRDCAHNLPMPAAAPVAPAADTDTAELDQYLIDLQAEANGHDENARHHQRLAKDARDRAAHLRAWRTKTSPSSTVAANARRGFQP